MSKTPPSQNSKKYAILLLLAAVLIILFGFIGDIIYKKYLEKNASSRWKAAEEKAIELGVYTSLDAYLQKSQGQKPALLDDFTWLKEAIVSNGQQTFDFQKLDGLSSISLPDSDLGHQENLEALRITLTDTPEIDASAEEIYTSALSAIDPANVDLDTFKENVEEANSLGGLENYTDFPKETLTDLSRLLILRNLCNLHLGSSDISDLLAVHKLNQLISKHGLGFTALSVALANEISFIEAISHYCHSGSATPEQVQLLCKSMSSIDFIGESSRALQTEYLFQIDLLSAILSDREHPLMAANDPLRSLPKEQVRIAKAELTEFNLSFHEAHLAGKSTNLHPDQFASNSTLGSTQGNSMLTQKLLKILIQGMHSHLKRTLNAELRINTTRIALASLAHRQEYNVPAYSIDQFVPEYLEKVPTIPYTDTPYTYIAPVSEEDTATVRARLHLKQSADISFTWPRS